MPRRHLVVTAGAELRLEFRYGRGPVATWARWASRQVTQVSVSVSDYVLGGMVISKRIGSQVPIEKL